MSGENQPAGERDLIDQAIVQRASIWMAKLWSGEVSDAERQACMAWRAEHPDHERAWQRLQVMESKLDALPREVARHTLREPAVTQHMARRRTLGLLGVAFMAGGSAYLVRESRSWQYLASDHATRVGQVSELTLPDGTQLTLNTATAIDVQFNELERRIVLREGEILVTTAADPATVHRPFIVQNRDGTVQALGTRFVVRQEQHASRVAVFEGAVEVRIRDALSAVRVNAGEGVSFSTQHVGGVMPVRESSAAAWSRGILVVEQMRVADFIAEIGRYRTGLLRCDPAIADLRVSGVFSLADTDRALNNLSLGLPVKVVYRTRYWVMVRPA